MKKWSEIRQGIINKLFMDEQEVNSENDVYAAKFAYFANECLNQIANSVKPRVAVFDVVTTDKNVEETMPDDFLSFADMINYLDGRPDPTVIYLGDKHIMLPEKGRYQIFYNALWKPISEENMDDSDLPIDQSVLNCIPSYVASQILAEDDIQRSTILKNEYELMLSRLDTNIMYQQNSYKSTGGWY
jgi:hypothetical protein